MPFRQFGQTPPVSIEYSQYFNDVQPAHHRRRLKFRPPQRHQSHETSYDNNHLIGGDYLYNDKPSRLITLW